ncbi:MAG TPA: flagellar hook-associated protein FlgK [Stellaceae bacterium]|nr:flagellar hook-associated protein FlgK [Stellaceae bacterium]
MSDVAISNAASGIYATQAQINTVSDNISNASTPGYSRKLQSQVDNGQGGGTQVTDVSRAVDDALSAQARNQNSLVASLTAQSTALNNIEQVSGDPTANTSLAAQFTQLKNSFTSLQASTSDSATQTAVITSAQGVVSSLNTLWKTADQSSTQAQTNLVSNVAAANALVAQVAQLNTQIVAYQSTNTDVTSLQDQRDTALKSLSGYLDVQVYNQPGGAVSIYTGGNQAILDGVQRTLTINGTGPVQITDPSGVSVTASIKSGSIGGNLAVRDQIVPTFKSQLDDVARAVTQGFDAIAAATPAVAPAVTGIYDLFTDGGTTDLNLTTTPTEVNGYAGRITVNTSFVATPSLLTNTTTTGDTTSINAAIALLNSTTTSFTTTTGLPASGSLADVSSGIITSNSGQASATAANLTNQTSIQTSLDQKVASVSGVNTDQEFTHLTQLQQSYSANAKVLQTAKSLFNTLFAAVGGTVG